MRLCATRVSFSVMAQGLEQLALHVIHADLLDINADWDTTSVRSTFWRFYINNRDTASITWREGSYRLRSGHLHLIPAYVRFDCHNTAPLRHLYVHFDLLGLPPFTQQQVFDRPFSSELTPSSRAVLSYGGSNNVGARSVYRDCLIQAALFDALSRHIAALPSDRRKRLDEAVESPNPVGPAMKLLESRLPGAIRVAELASVCAMSADHFSRVFKESIGQTPGRYILQRRIALAARELLYETVKIDLVAHRHGFANRFHFTRAFSRVMGITPAAYRQTNRV